WHQYRVKRQKAALLAPVPAVEPTSTAARAARRAGAPLTVAPVKWGLLYAFTLLALLSHLFLDFTNNYGIRPFFPFNPHWYAASIVFIFDPLIFALLLFALVLPSVFRLVSSEVGARRQPFAARGFAVTALVMIGLLYVLRTVEHDGAVGLASEQTLAAPVAQSQLSPTADSGNTAAVDAATGAAADATTGTTPGDNTLAPDLPPPVYLTAQRVLANPDPFNPFRWYTVTDFGPLYQLGEADTLHHSLTPGQALLAKPVPSAALAAAEATRLGRAYLDWSPMPQITVTPASQLGLDDNGNRVASGDTVVTFTDLRFMGNVPLLHMQGHTPLTGSVELDAHNRVVEVRMDGKTQRR
ncbi:MAG: metal-dependent hydrolase, partial [Bryocella sp.]